MKHKLLTFTLMGALASTMLFSCKNAEEPIQSSPVIVDAEGMVQYSLTVNIPDDMRTRAAAEAIVGNDGLYSFSRTIDRLWYGVYYNGQYLYDSENTVYPAWSMVENGKFNAYFKLHQEIDPTQVKIFFWAGNEDDNVTVSDVTSSDAINLNFKNRCVSVNPLYINGNTELKEYDSFAGYVQLSKQKENPNFNETVILKRPFAQIHILSDEFTFPGVNVYYPNGVTVVPGFGKEEASALNYTNNMMALTTWFFDSSIDLPNAYTKDEYIFSQNNYEFTNNLTGTSPERVKFKEREMDYLGCFYVFAPIEKSPLRYATASGNTGTLGKLNLAFRKPAESLGNAEFVSVDLPVDGIQANNRYVVYNHENTGDGDGGKGEGGFVTNTFTFEIITDSAWNDTIDSEY